MERKSAQSGVSTILAIEALASALTVLTLALFDFSARFKFKK